MRLFVLAALLLASAAASAQGIDRDSLLTDAPATPAKGTVRVSGGATGTGSAINANGDNVGASGVTGAISYTPFEHVSADVGVYTQVGASGPSARVRYQLFSQDQLGLDLSAGVRFKTVGFHPDGGELEFIVAAGRRFGKFELVLNGVFGVETGSGSGSSGGKPGGGGGKDLEAKGFAGYRFNEAVRAGLDSRLQAEVSDQEGTPKIAGMRDYDLTAGPAVAWMVTKTIQLQGLVGVAQPKKTNLTAPVGVVSASIDF